MKRGIKEETGEMEEGKDGGVMNITIECVDANSGK